jgi:hypothetical protein
MRAFLTITSILVFCIAVLAGGCSLFFTPGFLGTNWDSYAQAFAPIWLAGFAVSGLGIWIGRKLWRRRNAYGGSDQG